MDYKILQVHIDFQPKGWCTVTVAIQSNPNERTPTHYKAYQKKGLGIINDIYSIQQYVAAGGEKLTKENAAEIFPSLKHLGYY